MHAESPWQKAARRIRKIGTDLLVDIAEWRAEPYPEPKLDRRKVAALTADVEIKRDSWGVPHIYAASEHDCYFAQGFVHAQDRLWQMASMRALCEGELAALIGAGAIKADTFTRTLGWVQLATAELEDLDPALLSMMAAYCAGVNHFLSTSASLPMEFFVLAAGVGSPNRPKPWSPLHLVLVNRLMALQMSAGWQHQIVRQLLHQMLGEREALLWCKGTLHEGPHSPYTLEEPFEVNILSQLVATLDAHPKEHFPDGEQGSNWWVVSGEHTESGKPILANDPHLGERLHTHKLIEIYTVN
jgi:penicillin amidase